MPRRFKPIPVENFPTSKKVTYGTNCLAFALGLKRVRKKERYVLKMTNESMEIIFLRKVKELGFNPKNFKRIKAEEEAGRRGYIIRVYGFVGEETIDDGIMYDFHVIRREPDGQWIHKPGFYYKPRKITQEDWEFIGEKYGGWFISFAIEA